MDAGKSTRGDEGQLGAILASRRSVPNVQGISHTGLA
jgi:hypothetical protein